MLINSTMQNPDLQLASYDFDLPTELIADRPIEGRHNSKLLVYRVSENKVEHRFYYELPEILSSEHLLVFNQSKVFPCRLVGQKPTGGKCEVFIGHAVQVSPKLKNLQFCLFICPVPIEAL